MKKWVLSALAYLIVVRRFLLCVHCNRRPSTEDGQHINTEQHNE